MWKVLFSLDAVRAQRHHEHLDSIGLEYKTKNRLLSISLWHVAKQQFDCYFRLYLIFTHCIYHQLVQLGLHLSWSLQTKKPRQGYEEDLKTSQDQFWFNCFLKFEILLANNTILVTSQFFKSFLGVSQNIAGYYGREIVIWKGISHKSKPIRATTESLQTKASSY